MINEDSTDIAQLLETDRTAIEPLDAALEYLRRRTGQVLVLFLIAVAPLTIAMLWMIDEVTAEHRSGLAAACVALTVATFWRWGWQAVLQRRIQADLTAGTPPPLRPVLGSILWSRLVANFLITWGSILVIPPLYGMYLAGFAAPVMLEQEGPPLRKVWGAIQGVHKAFGRASHILLAVSVMLLLGIVAIVVFHMMLLETVMPNLLGMDTTSLRLTIRSVAWWLSVLYFVFLVLDCYWTVACVMIYYDLQAARLGTDLRIKLQRLENP